MERSLHRRLEASKQTRRNGDEDGAERSLQGSKQARRDGEMRRGGEEPARKTRGKQARRDGEMKSGRRGARKEN